MRLGILGTGMIVKDLLETIECLELESVYLLGREQSRDKTEELCRQYHLDGCYTDYEEMLQSDVDTVYVALPNHLHFEFAKKALLEGKHVIIEKPITANAGELEELIGLAQEKDCILLEAMNIHYLPAYQSLKEKIGELGKLKIINLNFCQYSSRYNAFKKGETLPVFDYKKAGGALMDINVYNLHAIIGMFGKPEKICYFANVERGIDTSGMLVMDYCGFKAVAIGAKDCQAPLVSTIQGDEGFIRINGPVNRLRAYEVSDNKGQVDSFRFSEEEHRLSYEFKEFIRIIEEHDVIKERKMRSISLAAVQIMEEARRQQGIIFEGEE